MSSAFTLKKPPESWHITPQPRPWTGSRASEQSGTEAAIFSHPGWNGVRPLAYLPVSNRCGRRSLQLRFARQSGTEAVLIVSPVSVWNRCRALCFASVCLERSWVSSSLFWNAVSLATMRDPRFLSLGSLVRGSQRIGDHINFFPWSGAPKGTFYIKIHWNFIKFTTGNNFLREKK